MNLLLCGQLSGDQNEKCGKLAGFLPE